MSENTFPPADQHQDSKEQTNEEVQRVRQPETMTEYVLSWKWLITGLLFIVLVGGSIGGLYYYRFINLSKDMLRVAAELQKTADSHDREMEKLQAENADREKIEEAGQKAYQSRLEAANLLIGYNQKQEGNAKVLAKINELLESLLKTETAIPHLKAQRQGQIIKNCQELIKVTSSNKDSFPYRMRIMELEWEQGNLVNVLDRAKEVLNIDWELNKRENSEALRYIALANLIRLPSLGYQPPQSEVAIPPYMDELLDKVLLTRPDDIDIAFRNAEFVIDVANREEFRKCASRKLLEMSPEDRIKKANSVINDMVSRNAKEVRAYLVRYEFKKRYMPEPVQLEKIDDDLQSILKLDPDNSDGLILAGMYSYRQSVHALLAGDNEKSAQLKQQAENYLKHVVEKKPNVDLGYQYLGDFYAREGKIDDAIRVWNDGVEKSLPLANPELVGRLVCGLSDQKRFDEATEKVNVLNRFVMETRLLSPDLVRQIRNLISLLNARVFSAEGTAATTKAEEAQSAGRQDEARRLYALSQKKLSDATQILEKLLGSFGKTSHDYVLESSSIYSRLLGESLMLAGRLMADQAKWDRAVFYFEAAMPFPQFRQMAQVAAANAYQRRNMPDVAVRLLGDAAASDSENMALQFLYAQSLFRQQMTKNNPSITDIHAVEAQFQILAEHANELANPWIIDINMINLEMVKESLSNDPDRIMRSQQSAIRSFRALENKAYPEPKNGWKEGQEKQTYSDDLGFLTEMAGTYSSLAQLSDFDRILNRIRELPNGEAVYFQERVNDNMRRGDKEGAVLVIEEALGSEILTNTDKQRFVVMLQGLKEEEPLTIDSIYAQLKTTYDANPDALKPQGFFLFANMALDREDIEYAKVLEDRLKQIEGEENGTMWRYVRVRRLLLQKDPPYDNIRQLQEEIVQRRNTWDMAYLLKATIEEQFMQGKEDDAELKRTIIDSYQMAIRCGNVQPLIWNRLLALYEMAGRTEDAQKLQREARIRNIRLQTGPGQFPQPYQRMYSQVHELLQDDPAQADVIARQCMVLAEGRKEKQELIYRLNMSFGKLFLDAGLTDSAKRHLSFIARRGGTYVYPLAVTLAKAGQVDEGFKLILDEIDRMPISKGTLIPSMLILLSQVRPSETIFLRIDKLMTRIENGERTVLKGKIDNPEEDNIIDLGNKRVQTMLLRFPNETELPDEKSLLTYPPEEGGTLELDMKSEDQSEAEETESTTSEFRVPGNGPNAETPNTETPNAQPSPAQPLVDQPTTEAE